VDGALLVIAGGIDYALRPPSRVQLLEATSGTVLEDTTLADVGVFAVALDPNRPLVYVGLSVHDAPGDPAFPAILILDRSTFAPVGRLDVPRDVPDCTFDCYKGVIALSDANGIYVAWGFNAINGTRVYHFSYPD